MKRGTALNLVPIFFTTWIFIKSMDFMARWIMIAGAILLVLGAIMHLAPWLLNWFGKLPGDIRIESERGKVFIPITSMIIVSIVLTIIVNIFKR